jgi:hypothetical protein
MRSKVFALVGLLIVCVASACGGGPNATERVAACERDFTAGLLDRQPALPGRVAAPSVPEDIRPVDEDDPRGVSINFVGLAVTITSILGALLLFNLAPELPPAWRLGSLALFSVLGGALAMLVVQVGIGVLRGSYFALTAVAALAIFAVASVSAAIIAALGFPGVGLSFMLFLMLGNPGSGAASAPELLPEPWKTGGQFLPPRAAATGLRNVAYFDRAQAEKWLTVLVVFAVIGIASLVRLGRRSARG